MAKEYSFQEVIARIKPGQVYVCTEDKYNVQKISMKVNYRIEIQHNGDSMVTLASVDARYRLSPKKVSFFDAVEAFKVSKAIKCEIEGFEYKYEGNYKGCLTDMDGHAITAEEVLEGKWYIEED